MRCFSTIPGKHVSGMTISRSLYRYCQERTRSGLTALESLVAQYQFGWIRKPLQDQDQLILPMSSYASTVTTLTTLQFINATNFNHVKVDDQPLNDDGGRISGSERIISRDIWDFFDANVHDFERKRAGIVPSNQMDYIKWVWLTLGDQTMTRT